MRAILVDWLVEVSTEYKLHTQTLFLAVNYIDRFLSCMAVNRSRLQLVGTCCMYVASKFEEIFPPELTEFVYITDDTYSRKQVIRMEEVLLKVVLFIDTWLAAWAPLLQFHSLFVKRENSQISNYGC